MANPALEALRHRWERFSQPGQAQLRIHQPGQPSRLLPLHPGAYRIGRANDCQNCIDPQAVRRRHALLARRGQHSLLRDQHTPCLLTTSDAAAP